MVQLLLIVLCSLSASSVVSQSPYYNSQVDIILNDLGNFLKVDNTSRISLPESYNNYLIVTLDLKNGYLTNLSTIHRIGNVNFKELSTNSTIMLSFQVGFDVLQLSYPFVSFYFLGMADEYKLNVTVDLIDVEVALGVMLSPTFHKCKYSINVMDTVVGSYNTQIYTKASIRTDTIESFLINRLLSWFSSDVEAYITDYMEPVLNAGLAQVLSTQIQTHMCTNATTTASPLTTKLPPTAVPTTKKP